MTLEEIEPYTQLSFGELLLLSWPAIFKPRQAFILFLVSKGKKKICLFDSQNVL